MKKKIQSMGAVLAFAAAALPLRADVIQCAGVLGNSGEKDGALVRFSDKPAAGLGVVADRNGSLWDRGGAGVLNRYAPDGRLLASYRIPGERSLPGDAIALAGEQLLLCLDRGLYVLPTDAPGGSAPKSLNIQVDQISLSSHDGWIAASKGCDVFLVNTAGEKKPVTSMAKPPRILEIGPDGAVYFDQDSQVYRTGANGAWTFMGTPPGERVQCVNGMIYGGAAHSGLRRFDLDWQPDPGVVLGGNSGAFIGHVDEQAEVGTPRGLAKMGPDLFALSGLYGTLHLLEWAPKEKRFTPVRRIGAVPECRALALDRQGRVWWQGGSWNWNDGPDTPLRAGIAPFLVCGLGMMNSDIAIGFGERAGKLQVVYGSLEKELRISSMDGSAVAPKEVAAVAVSEQKKRPVMLVLGRNGKLATALLTDAGSYQKVAEPETIETATQVKEWTSLVSTGPDSMVGAGDGFVIELARTGGQWKETARMNSWGEKGDQKFGGPIWLGADSGRVWVSDSARNRVVCFDLATHRELARYGITDRAGNDLAMLTTPRSIVARGARAVVFDSGNQRLVKLELVGNTK